MNPRTNGLMCSHGIQTFSSALVVCLRNCIAGDQSYFSRHIRLPRRCRRSVYCRTLNGLLLFASLDCLHTVRWPFSRRGWSSWRQTTDWSLSSGGSVVLIVFYRRNTGYDRLVATTLELLSSFGNESYAAMMRDVICLPHHALVVCELELGIVTFL